RPRRARASNRDDDLSLRLAVGQLADGLRRALERVRVRHVRVELALPPPLHELGDVGAVLRRLAADERAPEDTDDRAALQQREVERDLGDARGESDDEEA